MTRKILTLTLLIGSLALLHVDPAVLARTGRTPPGQAAESTDRVSRARAYGNGSAPVIYAEAGFEDGTLGGFTPAAGKSNKCPNGLCSGSIRIIDGPAGMGKIAEIRYTRLDQASSKDRNHAIKYEARRRDGFGPGKSFYVRGTWYIPRPRSALREQRKLIYFQDPQNVNGFVLNIHGNRMKVITSNCSTGRNQPIDYKVFAEDGSDLWDQPLTIEMLGRMNTGPLVPDGELTVWLNGQQLGSVRSNVCFLKEVAPYVRVLLGQQVSVGRKSTTFDEVRYLDDLVIANARVR